MGQSFEIGDAVIVARGDHRGKMGYIENREYRDGIDHRPQYKIRVNDSCSISIPAIYLARIEGEVVKEESKKEVPHDEY